MPLFYVGQPVICIDDTIKPVVARAFPQITSWPKRGSQYIIRRNITTLTRTKHGWEPLTFVLLRELTNPRITYMSGLHAEAGFHEIRFVPATDITLLENIRDFAGLQFERKQKPVKRRERKKEEA